MKRKWPDNVAVASTYFNQNRLKTPSLIEKQKWLSLVKIKRPLKRHAGQICALTMLTVWKHFCCVFMSKCIACIWCNQPNFPSLLRQSDASDRISGRPNPKCASSLLGRFAGVYFLPGRRSSSGGGGRCWQRHTEPRRQSGNEATTKHCAALAWDRRGPPPSGTCAFLSAWDPLWSSVAFPKRAHHYPSYFASGPHTRVASPPG